ncbi:retinal short-chain dehydrogenase reductase [Coniophora puteana RWD-64-598 SS2]|uniref:Short-chain dehydrogenase/reductase 3 n=1 Tax=Coniophora puteana (strain RWD-64-598) TaxID=741705 RepID=A0A5M3MSZ9_CONPW|nr:retinal short-chain dehydrogenase reductase [Coniophora puteana RWD-64-598 SS2]EIW82293.1 retinal short-chain dehydrogenase reductase [Coniophora puteana RWD-64-598 SS2]
MSSYDQAPAVADTEVTNVLDNVDIDMVMKVLTQTAFSPFFTFFVPIFYIFQGYSYNSNVVLAPTAYCAAISAFWALKWLSRLYRNQASLFFAPPRLDWAEEIVVITGGSSGIGELLANTLAVRNVTVVVLDVKPIVTENYNIAYYKCDVSKWEEVEAVSKQIVEELGHPTMLINNAGVVQGKLLLDLKPEDIQQTFGVNTIAQYYTLKAFLPDMIENKKGHIVTMSSVLGLVGSAQMTDYCASKAALVNLHESLRYELDHRYNAPQVRTTLVLPGHTLTPLFSTSRLPENPVYKFFVPSLPPVTIVKAIITALDSQHSQILRLPFYANFAPYLPLLPSYLRDLGQWLAGADYAMEGFQKVTGRRPEEGELATKKH